MAVGTSGNATTLYTYDRFGNPETMKDPLGQQESYVYDPFGNIREKVDRNGAKTTYTYDGLNRQLSANVVKNSVTTGTSNWSYTLTGQTKTMSNNTTATAFIYDALGRMEQETVTGGVVKNYKYDLGGNRTAFTSKVNNVTHLNTTYEYDELSRLKYVKENGVTQATYAYDVNSNRSSLTYPNGTTASYSYNMANMVTGLQNKAGNTVQSSYAYTYYLDGNQKSKADNTGLVTAYKYDALGRLQQEAESGAAGAKAYGYTYDPRGNRNSLTVSGAESYTVSYSYDLNNRLLNTVKAAGSSEEVATYRYDPNGNTVSQLTETFTTGNAGTGGLSLDSSGWELSEYNGFNQLVKTTSEGLTAEYTYSPDGLRSVKTVNGIAKTHIWDGQNIVAEMSGSTVTEVYLRGINLIYSQVSGEKRYYGYNAHGDVVQLTNASGAVVKSYNYDAFGVEKAPDANDANPWRYCGEYWDSGSGTYYL
jgi:YD repeat-containing protein